MSTNILKFNANEVTNIKLVWEIEEMRNEEIKNQEKNNSSIAHIEKDGDDNEEDDGDELLPTTFQPFFSHQIFPDEEIQGYDPIKLNIYMGAGSLTTFLDTNYTINSRNITNVQGELLKVFSKQDPPISKDSFLKYIEEKESSFRPPGKKISEYKIVDKETGDETEYEVYFGRITDDVVVRYHEKLQVFVLWFIDGSSYIYVDEPNWDIFFIFEKRIIDGEKRYGITGYSTIYNFYHHPEQTRARISQYLVLPPYQRMGHGKHLFNAIYQYYKSNDGYYGPVYDVTIEDPADEFNLLRNYVDLKNILDEKLFDDVILELNADNKETFEKIRKKLLIPYKQSKLCLEIYLYSKFTGTPENDPKFKQFRISIKKRLYKQNIGDSEQIEKMKQEVVNEKEEEEINQLQKQVELLQQQQNNNNIKQMLPPPPPQPKPEQIDKKQIEKDRIEAINELYKELEENYRKTLSSLNLTSK